MQDLGREGGRTQAPLSGRAVALAILAMAAPASALAAPPTPPDFGPNVIIFSPNMPVSQIQLKVDAIATQQVSNQFGTQRYALLFQPGTYGSSTTPLNFQVGYYTSVAGLGRSPSDVSINGSIDVYNQCDSSGCVALNNFWRSFVIRRGVPTPIGALDR
jgi:hypothetical protein